MICHFDKEFAFLSNFYPSTLELEGEFYPTVEHAFQAAKTDLPEERATVRTADTPGKAKHRGRRVTLRPDWEEVKNGVMLELLRLKFTDPGLQELLLATGEAELIEGNWWHDRYWGQCECARCAGKGRNELGRLLMQVRTEIRAELQKQERGLDGTE